MLQTLCTVPSHCLLQFYFDVLSTPSAVFCRLLPGVEDVAQNVADPECRSVASKAHATLLKVGADGKVTGIVANEAEVLAQLGSAVAKVDGQVGEVVVKYVASLLCGLINASKYKDDQWIEVGCELWWPLLAGLSFMSLQCLLLRGVLFLATDCIGPCV